VEAASADGSDEEHAAASVAATTSAPHPRTWLPTLMM
jgi:hypothetical protein